MPNENNLSCKVRFKLITGEEFEAEGNTQFIQEQQKIFFDIINKKNIKKQEYFLQEPLISNQNTSDSSSKIEISENKNNISTISNPWPLVLRKEGEILLLNKKGRLSPEEACLLLLAGGNSLYNVNGYSALSLARSLQYSGFVNLGRLDRMLNAEIQGGFIYSKGLKRSRNYHITPEGQAKAFSIAEQHVKK